MRFVALKDMDDTDATTIIEAEEDKNAEAQD